MKSPWFLLIPLLFLSCAEGEHRDEQRLRELFDRPEFRADLILIMDRSLANAECVAWLMQANWQRYEQGGRPPASFDELGTSIFEEDPPSKIDPWGNSYRMVVEGKEVRVSSSGPDGKPGTADDIDHP